MPENIKEFHQKSDIEENSKKIRESNHNTEPIISDQNQEITKIEHVQSKVSEWSIKIAFAMNTIYTLISIR